MYVVDTLLLLWIGANIYGCIRRYVILRTKYIDIKISTSNSSDTFDDIFEHDSTQHDTKHKIRRMWKL